MDALLLSISPLKKQFFQLILLAIPSLAYTQSDCLLLHHQNTSGDIIILDQRNAYNEEGKLLEEIKVNNSAYDGAYSTKRVFEYNQKGFLTKVTQYLNDTFKSATFYTYDGRGNLINESESNDPSGVNNIRSQLQNLNGKSEKTFFEEDGKVSGTEISQKNAEGKLLSYELRNGNGQLMQELVNQYNNAGKPVYEKRNDAVGHMIHETFSKYDAQNRIMADSTLLNGKMVGKTLFEYSPTGLKKRTRIDRNGSLDYSIEYKTDSRGNIIEETFFYRGDLSSRIERDYNAANKLIEERNYNQQNQLANTKTWEYSCPN